MANERILVVDDAESTTGVLKRLLVGAGYQVVTARTVTAALEALTNDSFAICIVDRRLPDGEGLDILRHIKQAMPLCEVIILTGYADVSSAVEALRLGAYDYLEKPVQDLRLILATISRALDRQALTQRNAQLVEDLQAANAELEMRRRQQLQYINHIGHALAGALQHQDVAHVLVRAILDSIECDAAGLLLLPRDGCREPWAMLGSHRRLSARSRQALLVAMLNSLPGQVRPAASAVQLQDLPGIESSEPDNEPWQVYEFGLLSLRDDLAGIAFMARHNERAFTDEALGFFSILVTQGAAALSNARLFARASDLATRDGLTGLYNHRHFYELLEVEISRARRHRQQLAVILLDMDRGESMGLKAVNDTYGHLAGDEMLCAFARFLERNVRRADIVARYGGDEFVIIAPQTNREELTHLVERLCEQIRSTEFQVSGHGVRLTVSAGAAIYDGESASDASRVVSMADRGTYLAKDRGGDQFCIVTNEGIATDGPMGEP